MNLLSKFLSLAFCVTSICAHATPSDTDRYIVLLADLLERKMIGDDELVQLIENAELGHVINPISQQRADISVSDFIYHKVAQEWVDEAELDPQQVAKWAQENLVEQERIRKKRKQVQQDTKRPWKEVPPERLSAGGLHTCAVKADGTVKCWGANEYGQCDVPSNLGVVQTISARQHHTCAVKTDGTVKCWGWGDQAPSDLGVVQSISTGEDHVCAVKSDGMVKCWGASFRGQQNLPPDLGVVQSLSAGDYHTCAVKANGSVTCWGHNADGKRDVPSDLGVVQSVSAGDDHTCAVKANGSVKCWGKNAKRQCDVPPDLGAVQSISAGDECTYAVKEDGMVKCWGDSYWCKVPSDLGVVQSVAAGNSHTCAVKADGSVQCWGSDWPGKCDVPADLVVLGNDIHGMIK